MDDLRSLILAIDDKKRVPVVIPEWPTPDAPDGVTVFVVPLISSRVIPYSQANATYPDCTASVLLAVFSTEDAEGNLIFKPDDIPTLMERSASPVRRIHAVASALTPTLEEIRKNSPALR